MLYVYIQKAVNSIFKTFEVVGVENLHMFMDAIPEM